MADKKAVFVLIFVTFLLIFSSVSAKEKDEKKNGNNKVSISAIDCNTNVYVTSEDKGTLGRIMGIWGSEAGFLCKIRTTMTELKLWFCTTFEGKNRKECMQGMGIIDKASDKVAKIINKYLGKINSQ